MWVTVGVKLVGIRLCKHGLCTGVSPKLREKSFSDNLEHEVGSGACFKPRSSVALSFLRARGQFP